VPGVPLPPAASLRAIRHWSDHIAASYATCFSATAYVAAGSSLWTPWGRPLPTLSLRQNFGRIRGDAGDSPGESRQFTCNRGEVGAVGLSIVVKPHFEKARGVVRIYKTSAPFADVNAALEREGGETIWKLHGMLRYTTVRFDDGREAVFTACESENASRAMAEKAKELRGKAGSQRAKLLPNDPEVVSGEVLFSPTKSQVLAHAWDRVDKTGRPLPRLKPCLSREGRAPLCAPPAPVACRRE
jgi:hypothetical protein